MRTPEDMTRHEPQPRSSVVAGSVWMVALTLLLFWVPLVNGAIGGLVGGYKVGSVKRALTAALLPAVVVAVGLWLLLIALDAPILGFVAGLSIALVVIFSEIGLFLGAAIGGAIAQSKRQPIPLR